MTKNNVKPVSYEDPNINAVELILNGHTYKLVFTFGALATAEVRLRKLGQEINMLKSLDFNNMNASTIVNVLYAALLHFHPDITPDDAKALITMKNVGEVLSALAEAFIKSMPDEPKNDPSEQPAVVS